MKKILLFFILIFISNPNYAVTATDSFTLTKQTIHTLDKSSNIKIDIDYPYLAKDVLATSSRQFNNLIKSIIDSEVNKFKVIVNESNAEEKTKSPSDIQIKYEILFPPTNAKPIVSIRFVISSYVAHGPYPNTTHRTLNFNFKTGNSMTLAELFLPKVDYIKTLNTYCAKKLTLITGETQGQLEEAAELTYENWNITSIGILMSYDEFPHALGIVEVLVPYTEISNILREKL